jgi:hypothetical protein
LIRSEIFFSDNTKVRILIISVAQSGNFFPEFNIRLYDKNSESDYFLQLLNILGHTVVLSTQETPYLIVKKKKKII